MILPASYAEWQHLSRFFTQAHVDDAIMTFKEIEETTSDDLERARAKAWRAYCTINAVLEGWEIKDWGSGEDTDGDLIGTAHGLADDARTSFGSDDFDILWALAYAKMAMLDTEASDLIDRAVKIAQQRSSEGDNYATLSLSSLMVEAADILVYQGELSRADATIHKGLYLNSAGGKKGVDWYHWVRALVLFNQALIDEDSGDSFVSGSAEHSYREVARILKQDMKRPEIHPDYEFDSLRLHAAAHWKLDEHAEKQKQLDKFKAKLASRKADWTADKEKFRSRYLNSGDAATLKAKWEAIADALFGP